jgi:glycosyltransferase involved in cell wall biosynthesis
LPNEKLVVAGRGPELERLKAVATDNVTFLGFVDDNRLEELMTAARAFVFAAEEDFGIVVVEAQARGTPVIALGRGGARETVITDGLSPTGVFFDTPTSAAIVDAIQRFRAREGDFVAENCHRHAQRYSTKRFEAELTEFVDTRMDKFQRGIAARAPFHQPTLSTAVIRSAAA